MRRKVDFITFVNLRNSKPIYEQIKDNIREQMVAGALKADDKLPSVRELAQQAAINPNTIQKAYRDLESEGLVYSVAGRGCFIAPPVAEISEKRMQALVDAMMPIVRELKFLGMDGDELVSLVRVWMKV